jgi:hypothetical protein
MPTAPELIDKREAARLIGGSKPVSISFIDQLLARKVLPRVKLSYKVTRIPLKAVSEYIAIRTVAPCRDTPV